MLELLGQTEPVPVPDEFSFRLKKALKEEKQNMIDDGLITGSPKKKNRWRIITSVAAIFAVGVISYSLYDNILSSIPYFNNSADQAVPSAAAEETNQMKTADAADETVSAEASVSDSASSSDGSVVMKDESNDLQPMMAGAEIPDGSAGNGGADIYGAVAGSEPETENQSADTGNQPAEAVESASGTSGLCDEFAFKSSMVSTQDDLSRSLTGSGLERNSAAVQYYNKQIEEKLSGFDYQILETTYSQTGEWNFRIFIFRGKDGNTYNEEIRIIGKDGEIKTICSNDFMGL